MIPKFRIFDKDKKQMVESAWWDFYFEDEGLLTVTSDLDVSYYADELGEVWELMQSTGLTDKNGKEIFEGDVIRIVHPFRGRTHIGEVIKEAYTYNVKDFYFSHYDIPGDAFSEGTEYMEVIGNIHKHPELLEKENEG